MMTKSAKPGPKSKATKKLALIQAPTVMLVDDHPLWRDTLRKVLERKRFVSVVAEAATGVEAVERARDAKPDVVIMDIQLPDKSGIEATRELVDENPDIKVLVLASSDKRDQVVAALAAGACGYLLKTAGSDDVRDAVRRVHAGEVVFPPQLADVVLGELRGRPSPDPAGVAPANTFRREGDYWTVGFDRDVFRLRDTRGVRYLSKLLGNPGREIHSLDLVVSDRVAAALGAEDAGPMLDASAKAAYRRRHAELQQDLAEAEAFGDIARGERARDEIDALTEQLSSAVGLGGRDRKAAAASERARVNVTLALRSTLAKISEYSPALSDHLSSTIKTGTYCSYTPDPRAPISWL